MGGSQGCAANIVRGADCGLACDSPPPPTPPLQGAGSATVTDRVGGAGFGRSRRPLARSFSASTWIAATTFSVTSGWATKAPSRPASVSGRRRPVKRAKISGAPPASRPRMATSARLARRGEAEVVGHVEAHERRDEQRLGAGAAHRAVRRRGQIEVPLAEGVVHLQHHGRQLAVRPMAVVEAERVEDVAQHPRHCQEPDRAAAGVDPGGRQHGLDLTAQRAAGAVAVVAVVVAEEGEAVVAEEPQAPIQRRELVEIEQQLEEAVAQPVGARQVAPVDDRAVVERAHAARSSGRAGAAEGPR